MPMAFAMPDNKEAQYSFRAGQNRVLDAVSQGEATFAPEHVVPCTT